MEKAKTITRNTINTFLPKVPLDSNNIESLKLYCQKSSCQDLREGKKLDSWAEKFVKKRIPMTPIRN